MQGWVALNGMTAGHHTRVTPVATEKLKTSSHNNTLRAHSLKQLRHCLHPYNSLRAHSLEKLPHCQQS